MARRLRQVNRRLTSRVSAAYEDDSALYFRTRLAKWGRQNRRHFPWRKTSNPFYILLAEMMLRRTNATQVISIYIKVTKQYRNAKQLAAAPRREVLAHLKPLGLAWRAKNILKMAEVLVKQSDGRVPSTYESLKQLPGVGEYVASAVACFAFDQPMPLVDTNTVRVVGRYFGIPTNAESRRRKPVRQSIAAVTTRRNTGQFNRTFLDFAALCCKAIDPDCRHCPLRNRCAFGKKKLPNDKRNLS